MRETLSTPVVLLVFNRPELTARTFESISKARPEKLLVVADGPRTEEEKIKCEAVRKIVSKVGWDCELLTNFSDINLGCRDRVATGLDWVFSEVEEAIILEDDCLPTTSFFPFCEALLKAYRYDNRVMMIAGANCQNEYKKTEYSYYFSKLTPIWGWATWRRAWKSYDVEMKTWPAFRDSGFLKAYCQDGFEEKFWTSRFNDSFDGTINTWDYAWTYACWREHGLSIVPKVNLISNIGFGEDSTHTSQPSVLSNIPTGNIWEIEHPPFIVQDSLADCYDFDTYRGGRSGRRKVSQIKEDLLDLSAFFVEKIKSAIHEQKS